MTDTLTRDKWNKSAKYFDLMAGLGAERRWEPAKRALFANIDDGALFLAAGTGLDFAAFPAGKSITAIDISPAMLEIAAVKANDYDGNIELLEMDANDLDFEDNSFQQVFTSCTFCSVPNPVHGLQQLHRVLKPGGRLYMFEHTGSHYYPFKPMMKLMSLLSEKVGPSMDRETVQNVKAAGFEVLETNNLFLDVVKTIKARKP